MHQNKLKMILTQKSVYPHVKMTPTYVIFVFEIYSNS